ncbi:pyrroline-5-carboxylate reductase [Flavobacteriaceae bacterium F08102]|nr:pyrroline-5-carboxylate reductase [Flavobacteriaceae bacterium F08102]
MKIAIIGAGNLGRSIAKGLIVNNAYTSLFLTKRNIDDLESWAAYKNVQVTTENKEAVKQSDILIFTVQPRHIEHILFEIKDLLTDKHVLISTITGFKIQNLEALLGSDKFIIRAMPNTAIAVAKSITCMCANQRGKDRILIAKAVFDRLGTTVQINEEQMQAATVICASGIAFWMRLIRATTQGAIQLGFEAKIAQEMAMQTCLGAATLLEGSGKHPEEEIDRVTTPGGCTIEGLNQMEHSGLSSSLIKGIVSSYQKINQLNQANL